MTNLTNYNIDLNKFDQISIKSIGGVALNISLSDKQYIECQIDSELHSFECESGTINIVNKDKVEEKDLRNLNNMPKNKDTSFLDVVYNLAKDVVELSHHKSEYSKKNLVVNLFLKKDSKLELNGDNYDLALNNIILKDLSIDCENIDIEGKSYQIEDLKISSSNIKGELLFNENNHKIKIDGNNAKIKVIKGDFNGAFNLDGNNLKVDSSFSYLRAKTGENLFSAELNNGKITIV